MVTGGGSSESKFDSSSTSSSCKKRNTTIFTERAIKTASIGIPHVCVYACKLPTSSTSCDKPGRTAGGRRPRSPATPGSDLCRTPHAAAPGRCGSSFRAAVQVYLEHGHRSLELVGRSARSGD